MNRFSKLASFLACLLGVGAFPARAVESLSNRVAALYGPIKAENAYLLDRATVEQRFDHALTTALKSDGSPKDGLSNMALGGAWSLSPALAEHHGLRGQRPDEVRKALGPADRTWPTRIWLPFLQGWPPDWEGSGKPLGECWGYEDFSVWFVNDKVTAVTPNSEKLQQYLRDTHTLLTDEEATRMLNAVEKFRSQTRNDN